jgi:hypothetical protein
VKRKERKRRKGAKKNMDFSSLLCVFASFSFFAFNSSVMKSKEPPDLGATMTAL